MEIERIQLEKNTRTIQQRNAGSANIMDSRQHFLSGTSLQRVEDDEEKVMGEVMQQKNDNSLIQRFTYTEDDVKKASYPASGSSTNGLHDNKNYVMGSDSMLHHSNMHSKYRTKFFKNDFTNMYAVGEHEGDGYRIKGVDTRVSGNPFNGSSYVTKGKDFMVFFDKPVGVKGKNKRKLK